VHFRTVDTGELLQVLDVGRWLVVAAVDQGGRACTSAAVPAGPGEAAPVVSGAPDGDGRS
jgi:hypothetical protein